MHTFVAHGRTFIMLDDDTVLCPQDDKSYVSDGLEVVASELLPINPRLAQLTFLKAAQERTGH